MLTLRLTNKVLKELPLPKSAVLSLPEHGDVLEDWYVHVFVHEKRRHLMFTHAGSLVSFVAFGVYQRDMKDLEKIFRREFSRFLTFQRFDQQDILMFQLALGDMRLAKTIDRRVTGSMVQLIEHYKWCVSDAYSHKGYTPEDYAQYELNRIPLGALKYAFAIEMFHKTVDVLKGFHHIPGQGVVGLN